MTIDQVRHAGGVTAVLERPGARLMYEVAGDGPAVVLIHGFGLDMRMWDPQVGPLADRFRVVRYDCRGFGASGPFDPAVPYTHAGDLVALLDHLDIGEAVLAGLSFGGRVALQAALADPARVRGLALLDAVLDGVPWDPESARALDEVARLVQEAGCWRAARPGWPTRCSPPRASGLAWPPRWRPWWRATPASTGWARTRTARPGRPSTCSKA
ncbi:MAG: alpha/beta fold hydrolase, partial [Streptosporangiaceae bacterium]